MSTKKSSKKTNEKSQIIHSSEKPDLTSKRHNGLPKDNPINNKGLLDVMIMEYKSLRGELISIFDREIQLFTIIVSALGVIYGIIFSGGFYDLILFIPLIIFPLALKYKFGTYGVMRMGKYLLKLENGIKNLINNNEKNNTVGKINWIGWQHYWEWEGNKENKIKYYEKEGNVILYDVSSKWLLFIIIPTGLAFLYSMIIINPSNFTIITSNITKKISILNNLFHSIIAFIYMTIIIASGIYLEYKIFKKIVKPEINNK